MSEIRDSIYKHRKDFDDDPLDYSDLSKEPLIQFESWLKEAVEYPVDEALAVCLNTNAKDGYPSSRIVYLREVIDEGLVFYTNYTSLKGEEMAANEKASLNFFWNELHRQVRVKGDIEKADASMSDAYFSNRPRESQLGAWASSQSRPLDSRETLALRIKEFEKEFEGKEIPRPEHWGGYVLKPVEWEFWKGRSSRLHDRFRYTRQDNAWDIVRLFP